MLHPYEAQRIKSIAQGCLGIVIFGIAGILLIGFFINNMWSSKFGPAEELIADGKPQEAIDYINSKLIKGDRGKAMSFFLRAKANSALGRMPETVADARKAFAKDPSLQDPFRLLVASLVFSGNPKDALEVVEKRASLFNPDTGGIVLRADLLALTGRPGEALAAMGIKGPHDFQSGVTHNQRDRTAGECLFQQGEYAAALSRYKGLVQFWNSSDAKYAPTRRRVGDACLAIGDYKGALFHYEEVSRLSPLGESGRFRTHSISSAVLNTPESKDPFAPFGLGCRTPTTLWLAWVAATRSGDKGKAASFLNLLRENADDDPDTVFLLKEIGQARRTDPGATVAVGAGGLRAFVLANEALVRGDASVARALFSRCASKEKLLADATANELKQLDAAAK